MCPPQSALGARGSAEDKAAADPLAGGFWWEEGTLASGLGRQGSALFQTHSGRRGQKQWLEAFGRGPEGKKKKNPHFAATAWATSLRLLPHAGGAETGSMDRRTTHIKETIPDKTSSLQPALSTSSISIFARH